MAYDDWRQVVRSVIFRGANLVWFSFPFSSESELHCLVVDGQVLAHIFMCSAWHLQCWLVRLVYGEVGVVFLRV
jgi:hypothetical protein